MTNLDLIYRLDGDEERISMGLSVFEIAPILLSVGELIKESNKTIYPTGRDIAVNVKPFRQGSFIIDIVIFSPNNLQQVIDFVNTDGVSHIKILLEWIGILYGSSVSLYKLVKFLKGKPKTVQQISPNEIRYTGEDNNSITVGKEVHQLFQNCTIQTVFYNGFGRPLEQSGINKIETYLDEENPPKIEFTNEDAKSLKDYSEAEIPSVDLEEVVENTMEVFLSPKRGSFDADPRQWSFRMGGAENQVITATIKDDHFLEQCRNGEIKPHHTDILKVHLIQKIKKINGRLDPNSICFEIEEILEYQVGNTNTQTNLNVD